jgi:5-methylcytosine-specific restriction enzyme subunit McrC
LEEGQRVNVSESDYDTALELLSRVLINGCNRLLKRGIESNYSTTLDEYAGIKGKIIFKDSINHNSFRKGKAYCQFDKYDSNTLPNQLLKSTIRLLIGVKTVDKKIVEELWKCYWKFQHVDDIVLRGNLFSMVRIHKNNSAYDFLLRICRLIFDNTVFDENSGEYHFKEFLGNDKAMASLFEAFVRNFYGREQDQLKVRREDITWDAVPLGESSDSYLPKMQTDITLESFDRKIIIETKYYAKALNTRYDAEKFNSGNLYQIYSYLRNIETSANHPKNNEAEGILLYPTAGYNLNEKFKLGSHNLSIRTIDLSKSWMEIHNELLNVVEVSTKSKSM